MVTTYPTIHVIVLVASRMKRLPVVSNEDADMLQMIGNYLLFFSKTCKKKKKGCCKLETEYLPSK